MRIALAGLCLALSGVAVPALAQTCDGTAATVYALTAPDYRVDGEPVLGRSAYACGRYWSAANLMEKAASQRSSSLQRFNLAATYAQTGRLDEAEALYRTVVADGDFVRARADSSTIKRADREIGFGLGEEASRRLVALDRMRSLFTATRQTASTVTGAVAGPRPADEAGVNAITTEFGVGPLPAGSAGVDAVAARSGISDLEALRRDGLSPVS